MAAAADCSWAAAHDEFSVLDSMSRHCHRWIEVVDDRHQRRSSYHDHSRLALFIRSEKGDYFYDRSNRHSPPVMAYSGHNHGDGSHSHNADRVQMCIGVHLPQVCHHHAYHDSLRDAFSQRLCSDYTSAFH